jgi:hypothetical protein
VVEPTVKTAVVALVGHGDRDVEEHDDCAVNTALTVPSAECCVLAMTVARLWTARVVVVLVAIRCRVRDRGVITSVE